MFWITLAAVVAFWLLVISIVQLLVRKFNRRNFLLALGWILFLEGANLTYRYRENGLLLISGFFIFLCGVGILRKYWLSKSSKASPVGSTSSSDNVVNDPSAKRRKWLSVGGITLLLLLIGGALSYWDDTKPKGSDDEILRLFEEAQHARERVRSKNTGLADCVAGNEIEKDLAIADRCITDMDEILTELDREASNAKNLARLYVDKKDNLDRETTRAIEQILKIWESTEYTGVITATRDYLNAHIDYFRLLKRGGNAKLEGLNEEEAAQLIAMGHSIERLTRELQAKREVLRQYTRDNLNPEFLEATGFKLD